MKAFCIIGIIIAIAMVIFAAAYPVPEKYVFVSSLSYAYDSPWNENTGAEYSGGDAYNYQIEASLKAGYLSGVLTMKTVMFVGGILLFFLSLFSYAKLTLIRKQTESLTKILKTADTMTVLIGQSEKQADNLNKIINFLKARFPEDTCSNENAFQETLE